MLSCNSVYTSRTVKRHVRGLRKKVVSTIHQHHIHHQPNLNEYPNFLSSYSEFKFCDWKNESPQLKLRHLRRQGLQVLLGLIPPPPQGCRASWGRNRTYSRNDNQRSPQVGLGCSANYNVRGECLRAKCVRDRDVSGTEMSARQLDMWTAGCVEKHLMRKRLC